MRLDAKLKELGYRPLKLDKCLYVLKDKAGKLLAVISTHVDDLKCAGSRKTLESLATALEKQFGKCSTQWNDFIHCGIKHQKHKDGSITLDQNHYKHQINPMKLPQLTKSDRHSKKPLDAKGQHEYHSCVGALGWLNNTRTDIMVKVSELQTQLGKATILDVTKLNSLVKWVHRHDLQVKFPPIKPPFKILSINDAAFCADAKGRSQRGSIILLMNDSRSELGGLCHELGKASKTIKRVCRSTYSSELQAACQGLDESQFAAILLEEIFGSELSWPELRNKFEKAQLRVPVDVLTDCRSLYDSIVNWDDKKCTETNLFVHVQCLRQDFRSGRCRKFVWVTTRDMVADGLTKGSIGRDALRDLLKHGKLVIREPPLISTSRKRQPSKQPSKKKPAFRKRR